jgi:hypothetical protein
MRRLSPSIPTAVVLLLVIPSLEVSAAPRSHGFKAPVRAHVAGRHFGSKHGFRHQRQFGFHQRGFHQPGFGRFGAVGGFWPGYLDDGYGAQQPVYVQQNVATSVAAYPTVLDLPAVAGIRSEPAAQPVIYVIKGQGRRAEPPLVRKGEHRPGAKVIAVGKEQPATTGSAAPAATGGARIVEVTARRGL